jgi:hypothetical protein
MYRFFSVNGKITLTVLKKKKSPKNSILEILSPKATGVVKGRYFMFIYNSLGSFRSFL